MNESQPELASGVILAKNAESTIGAVVESLHRTCAEVVVIDTGSTDETRLRAVASGARVVEYAWADDFSAARNFAHAQVKHDWVFFLDTDWELRESANLTALNLRDWDEVRLTWVNQWDGPQKLSQQPRTMLYRASKYVWRGRVHEYLEYADSGRPRVITVTDEVWHRSSPGRAKEINYTELLRADLVELPPGPRRTRTLMFLSQSLSSRGEWTGIIRLLAPEIRGLSGEHALEVLEYFVVAVTKEKRAEEFAEVVERALRTSSDPRRPLVLGDLYSTLEPSVAAQYYLAYVSTELPREVVERNWERYRVYPYMMLGNLAMGADSQVASEFMRRASENTRMEQKRAQLQLLVENLRART